MDFLLKIMIFSNPDIQGRFALPGNGKESFYPTLDTDADHHQNLITSKMDLI